MQQKRKLPPASDKLPKEDPPLSDTWYTIEEIMKRFKRSKSTINRWRRNHHLICTEIESVVLVNKDDLDQFLRDHRKG